MFCVFMNDPQIRLQHHAKVDSFPEFSLTLRAKTLETRGIVMLSYLHINLKF